MATIVYSSYVIRYPVGGILSSNLQFLRGFARLGHEVVLVESNGWPDACFSTRPDGPSMTIRRRESDPSAPPSGHRTFPCDGRSSTLTAPPTGWIGPS